MLGNTLRRVCLTRGLDMDFSFREKSAAVSLLAVLGTYGYYFYFVLLGSGPTTPADMLVWMIGLVVVY